MTTTGAISSERGYQPLIATPPITAGTTRTSNSSGVKIVEERQFVCDVVERVRGHGRDLPVVDRHVPLRPPGDHDRKGDEPTNREQRGPAEAVAEGDERHEHEPDQAVAQLDDRREPDREPGRCRGSLTGLGPEQNRERHDDEHRRQRLGVEVEPGVDVPLAVLPGPAPRHEADPERPGREQAGRCETDRAVPARPEAEVRRRDGRDSVRDEAEQRARPGRPGRA